MSHIKLILLDVDGTTVEPGPDALPTQAVVDAVQAAQEAGIAVALATGRPYQFAKPVSDALGLTGVSVLNGGTELRNLDNGEILEKHLMEIGQIRELVRLALPLGFGVFTEDDQYETALTKPEDIDHPIAKVFLEAVRTEVLTDALAVLAAVPDTIAYPTRSWEKGDVVDIHITHALATKQHGVEKLIEKLGLHKGEIMAIGDDYNDVPLFEIAGLSIAMGNAPDEVKALVDHVVPSLEEDGVAVAIRRFALEQ